MADMWARFMNSLTTGSDNLPEASMEDVSRQRAEYEAASKHGHETRDALVRLAL